MNAEIIRDKTVGWVDRLFGSPYFDVACWAVIVLAVIYFLPAVIRILAR